MHLHEILAEEFGQWVKYAAKKWGGDVRAYQMAGIRVVETGTIRGDNEASLVGDGYSTLWIAQQAWISLTSIDLDVSTAEKVLDRHKSVLEGSQNSLRYCVNFIQGYSISELAKLMRFGPHRYDAALLDSENDPQLILHEFMIARELVRNDGLILVDDCTALPEHDPVAKKGDLLLPYLKQNDITYRVHTRHGWNGYKTGVIAIGPRL